MNTFLVWLLRLILPRRFWYRRIYLWSTHWRELREKKIKQVKRRCSRCGQIIPFNQIIHVHHKQYYRNGKSILWREKLNDLQVLHEACHKLEHSKG